MASNAFIDNTAHPTAMLYYKQNPFEPIPDNAGGSVAIGDVAAVGDKLLSDVLAAILKSVKPGGSILLVGHGTKWGLSLTVGMNRHHQVSRLQVDALAVIRTNLAGQASDDDTAAQLFLTPGDYKTLKERILALKKLKLARVDLRACNTGADVDTLGALLEFFDCDVLCAPDILDSFGKISIGTPTKNPEVWQRWRKEHPRANTEGTSAGAFAYQIDIDGNSVKIDAMADSKDRVAEWVKSRLGGKTYTGGDPYYHALAQRSPELFVFAGEAGFAAHLKQITRDQVPKRGPITIDPNAPLPRP